MDATQGRVPCEVPVAVFVHPTTRRLSPRYRRLLAPRPSPRRLLYRLLLGAHGFVVHRGRHERALDRCVGFTCPVGKAYSYGALYLSPRWRGLGRGRGGTVSVRKVEIRLPALVDHRRFNHGSHVPMGALDALRP